MGLECTINSQNLMKSLEPFLRKWKFQFFFLMWTTLYFEGRSKTKNLAWDICKGTLDIEYERDWPVVLSATLDDGQKINNFVSSFRDFPGKTDSVVLMGFECTINPENVIKIVGVIFEKIKFFKFFLMWTTLNFRVKGKTKKRLEIFTRGP